jgi:phosphoglycolate phosphatase
MLCQERMGLDANSCAYVGDTSMDIAAGRAAGMKTIGVLTGFDSRDDLLQQNPDHIIDSILDLPRALDLYGPPSIQKMKKKKDLP